jgi:hypothetical protein
MRSLAGSRANITYQFTAERRMIFVAEADENEGGLFVAEKEGPTGQISGAISKSHLRFEI